VDYDDRDRRLDGDLLDYQIHRVYLYGWLMSVLGFIEAKFETLSDALDARIAGLFSKPAINPERIEQTKQSARADFQFINAGEFLENFIIWRLLALEGRLGGGKTLMSVALAKYLYDNKLVRGVFANFPIDEEYIPYVPSCINTCVILDEGWSFADSRGSARGFKGYGAFFRKLGSYFISPSVYRVDKRMRPVSCARRYDLWLFKMWLYDWFDVTNSKGWYLFRGYESLFNRYDHRFVPADDGGILEVMTDEVRSIAGSRRIFTLKSGMGGPALPYADPLKR
jgi:hypothetical protein